MTIFYHGGSKFNKNKIGRSYESTNSGSVGYYITTNERLAKGFGPINHYKFNEKKEMNSVKLKQSDLLNLINITKYWEAFGETPYIGKIPALEALKGQSTIDIFLDLINSTGELEVVLNYFIFLGISHYLPHSEPNGTIIVIDGNCLQPI